tara:strand:- start:2508 stop:2789 length:282 start_codon:yes stop_codon:yes gene_type:complete
MSVLLIKNGLKKNVSTGYSWKCLMFGCLYPVCIGDFKGAFRHFCYASLTFGLSILFVPFFYNRKKLKSFLEDGYKPFGDKDEAYLVKKLDYQS